MLETMRCIYVGPPELIRSKALRLRIESRPLPRHRMRSGRGSVIVQVDHGSVRSVPYKSLLVSLLRLCSRSLPFLRRTVIGSTSVSAAIWNAQWNHVSLGRAVSLGGLGAGGVGPTEAGWVADIICPIKHYCNSARQVESCFRVACQEDVAPLMNEFGWRCHVLSARCFLPAYHGHAALRGYLEPGAGRRWWWNPTNNDRFWDDEFAFV